jgi:carbon storage regulator
MLVLARRVGERVVIGNEVVVEVLSVSGDVVRLGVVAPRETSVHRFEVFQELQAANRAASNLSTAAPPSAVEDLAASLRRGPQGAAAPAAPAGDPTSLKAFE